MSTRLVTRIAARPATCRVIGMAERLGTRRITGLAGIAVVAAALSVTMAQATPNHAHWHYLIGARANFARSFATQLHHEAIAPGTLHLEPARVNAEDLTRLSAEIIARVDELERVSSDEENALIGEYSNLMRTAAKDAATLSAELLGSIDREMASGRMEIASESSLTGASHAEATLVLVSGAPAPPEDSVRNEIATHAVALFRQFGVILKAHKDAEHLLGILPPNPVP